ncbi:MAG: helix-turn-helix domain-containing protein [Anaerolineae bacterium]|nr:helix-turn-helix domain-containing protein [Anaerolineae bacterium]
MSHVMTPGGKRLRALREYHGKTQLDVELDASLGIGYLQRLESGRVQQPERDTLERILAALDARYSERREVLELFGYVVDAPIPNDAEIEWAVSVCRAELDSAAFPTYLLDCAHRLLYWNALVPRLYVTPGTNLSADGLRRLSVLKLIFDPAYHVTPRIVNGDAFFPAQIRALRYEMQRFHDEPWMGELIDDMRQSATFARYWDLAQREAVHFSARPLTLMEIAVTGVEQALNFRIISEPFVQDHRFRVIFCLPADAHSNQQCIDWLSDAIKH